MIQIDAEIERLEEDGRNVLAFSVVSPLVSQPSSANPQVVGIFIGRTYI
jgi:hypothetical protein